MEARQFQIIPLDNIVQKRLDDIESEIIFLEEKITQGNEEMLAASIKGDGQTIKTLSKAVHDSQSKVGPLFSELERLHIELDARTIEFEERLSAAE